jgi:hypothetical protein
MITKERLLEIVGDSAAVKQSIWPYCCPFCTATKAEIEEMAQKLLSLPADWQEDSSLETWFPLTAEELKRTKEEKNQLIKELKEFDKIIDEEGVARSCINPKEDLRLAIRGLKEDRKNTLRNYQELASHHNVNCTCLEIY